MKLVDPSDPDLIAIGEHVNGELCVVRPVPSTQHGREIIACMLQAAALEVCPARRLMFSITSHKVGRMAAVECWEVEPHMSQENPYQSQASMDQYAWMLRGLVQAKLETFLGRRPLWLDPHCPTSRVTIDEYFRSQVCAFRPRPYTVTRSYNCSRR